MQLNLPPPQPSVLTEDVFARLRTLIYEKTGIFFQDNKRYLLENRVGRRIAALGLADFGAYLRFVQNGGVAQELMHLVNAVTINETFFFRNTAQMDLLEADLLPELVRLRERDGTRRVRFWSAGCSTGDEPYTLALLVRERFAPRYPGVRFEIVGTDINTEVLDQARAGAYGDYAVRNVPAAYLQKHFRREEDRFVLSPEVRRLVSFKRLNLADRSAFLAMRGFDVIICANVLIYFDEASKQQVLASLCNALNPEGYLLVGFSETLYGTPPGLSPIRFAKSIAYKKG